jgi:hypothetical protein
MEDSSMSILDRQLGEVPPEQLREHIIKLKDYLRNVADPNETSINGQTAISIALLFCFEEEEADIIGSLMSKGGNPNIPCPFQNFVRYTLGAKKISILQHMIDGGLQLNNTFTAEPEFNYLGSQPFTILDYTLDIQSQLNKNRVWASLAKKYAGGIGQRRRFIDETIALLKSHGAKQASELT